MPAYRLVVKPRAHRDKWCKGLGLQSGVGVKMAGFGKRGLNSLQRDGATLDVAKPGDTSGLREAPAPRIQTGGTLRWSPAIKLNNSRVSEIPQMPGVYALVFGMHDEDIVFIAGTKNLRDEFIDEIRTQSGLSIPRANAFSFAEANTPYEQADREMQSYRRRFGKKPLLNSGF